MYGKSWKPAEVNILLTAVDSKGVAKGSALAGRRLGRSAAACMQKYYIAIKNLPTDKVNEVEPEPVIEQKIEEPSRGGDIITGKLVAKGENLLVVKAEGKFIMINT